MKNINFKSLLFSFLAVPVLGLIYWVVNSQGIRMSIAIFGKKLYSLPVPGFSYLQHYQNFRDLDLAHVFAVFMLFAVWVLSVALLEIFLFGLEVDERVNTRFYIRFLYCISTIVLITDVVMFYRGIVDQGGLLDSGGGVTPIIATIGYTGLLAFVAYVHVMLKRFA